MTTTIRAAVIAAVVLLPIASGAGAQAPVAISFSGLPRKQLPTHAAIKSDTSVAKKSATAKSDTAAAKRPAPAAAKPETSVAKLRRQIAAQRDSIALLRKNAKPPVAGIGYIDSVYRVWFDTVIVDRIDTVKILGPAKPATASVPPAFVVSGLTQVMLTGGGNTVRTTYRLRRVELKVTSDLGNKAQAIVMVDAAKALALNTSGTQPSVTQSSRMLQDAYVTMPLRLVSIDAGQQRLPLGYEGSMGASSLETIERALMESDKARGASFGDVRDAGVALRRVWSAVDYRVGVFNGSGETMNDVDKQVGKAVVGQLSFHPKLLNGLRLGVSGATSGSGAGDNPVRDRVGADVRFLRGPISLQLEGMTGQDGVSRRLGGYALATLAPRPQFKLVARVDSWDPDRATDKTAASVVERDYLGGFTWLPAATRLKLQLNVVRKTYLAGVVPSSTLVLSQLQASW
jgi:hypothetical protein